MERQELRYFLVNFWELRRAKTVRRYFSRIGSEIRAIVTKSIEKKLANPKNFDILY